MWGAAMTAAFEHVEEAGKIGVKIGMRILQRVPNARLRREMHHWAELAVAEDRLGAGAVGKIELVTGKVVERPQDREPGLLERRVVIVVDTVDADDGAAAFEEPPCQYKADKARGAGDQNWSLRR